ncbi:TolC family protein [Variovorax sp. PBL-E5]|uniref:TolC family protein n=1 Tax=Variovorax sp. PBL-E5 TaxID=434014 RepID=UPI001315E93A|nr:TolC family protein [Variovorax sp. PBL-E5]VTU32954.1 Outer membrane efflux protein [Variovorax sp. PBL-E5]
MFHSSPARWSAILPAAGTLLLAGCATVGIDDALQQANTRTRSFTEGKLTLARTDAERQARTALATDLLSRPLSQDDAVQLALANSPAVQALLAQAGAEIAGAVQSGRPANPVFTFERMRLNPQLELDRLLSFGLLDLLLWPQRRSVAQNREAEARLMLAGAIVDQVTQVRQAWVRAVGAQQSLQYAGQVNEAAEASAELARRMQQAGNFSPLQRARQQLFQSDAMARLAAARHASIAAREALVRALGLDDAQAARLQLPPRLPELPDAPRDAHEVAATAAAQRLDVQLARERLEIAGKSQGMNLLPSFVGVDAGLRRDTVFDNGTGARGTRRGFELDIRLPLFDWGTAQRGAMDAQALAAAHRYDATVRDATSRLREAYSGYRSAYDIARHERDDVVPLRQSMADENLLRYNGMLIGVFELLADARDQIAGVDAALQAQQQFWLADAALAASVIGRPIASAASTSPLFE